MLDMTSIPRNIAPNYADILPLPPSKDTAESPSSSTSSPPLLPNKFPTISPAPSHRPDLNVRSGGRIHVHVYFPPFSCRRKQMLLIPTATWARIVCSKQSKAFPC